MKRTLLLLVMAVLLCLTALTVVSGSIWAEAEEVAEPVAGFSGEMLMSLPFDKTVGNPPLESGYIADWTYEDDSIKVKITKDRAFDTDYLVAIVEIVHPSQIRTTVAGRHNTDETVKGFVMAKRVNAVMAINGDYYSYRDGGYIIRQAKQYRNYPNKLDTLLIDEKGDFHVIEYATRKLVDEYIEQMDSRVINSFAFGPLLVRDGKKVEEIHYFDAGTKKPTQRMGIAQIGPLKYMCVSTEGPEDAGSRGVTVEEFAELMESLGVDIAYNLDGGSSNTLVFQNAKINSPDNPKERYIFDILYFATLETGD